MIDAGLKTFVVNKMWSKHLHYVYESLLNEGLAFNPEVLDSVELPGVFGSWRETEFNDLTVAIRQQGVKYIGEGSSRIVFLVDNDKVLKVAKNKAGLAQNEAEVNVVTHPRTNRLLLADIYDYSTRDFRWVLSEYAKEPTPEEFKEIIKLSFNWFEMFLDYYSEDSIEEFGIRYASKTGKRFERKTKEFLVSLMSTINVVSLEARDLGRLEQWGITKDNRLVLVDYGFDSKVSILYMR
mgnify:CR=1 FL=1